MRNIRAGDFLSALSEREVAITAAATAQAGFKHLCTGTSADYTVTLPPAAACLGQYIGFRMGTASTLTKLVTLDGNASETIDGTLTRIMWSYESCVLYCDGSNWFKIAGKPIQMYTTLSRVTNQSLSAGVWTAVAMTAQVEGTPQMYDSGNSRAKIIRPGVYIASALTYITGVTANAFMSATPNATTPPGAAQQLAIAGGAADGATVMPCKTLAAADYIQLSAYGDGTPVVAAGTNPSYLSVTEITQW